MREGRHLVNRSSGMRCTRSVVSELSPTDLLLWNDRGVTERNREVGTPIGVYRLPLEIKVCFLFQRRHPQLRCRVYQASQPIVMIFRAGRFLMYLGSAYTYSQCKAPDRQA